MRKCIMVKLSRGKRKTHKICEKQVNFTKSERNLKKVGGNNNFPEIWEKCTETAKVGGKFKIFESMNKNRKSVIRNFGG